MEKQGEIRLRCGALNAQTIAEDESSLLQEDVNRRGDLPDIQFDFLGFQI
jgi:hypothetical protein